MKFSITFNEFLKLVWNLQVVKVFILELIIQYIVGLVSEPEIYTLMMINRWMHYFSYILAC